MLALLLVVQKDAESGLDEVDPHVLMATLKARAAPVTVLDAQILKAVQDKKLTFDDETRLPPSLRL